MPSQITPSVTLTRKQIATILLDYMGWEHVDVRSFWKVARMITADSPPTEQLQITKDTNHE